MLFNKMRVAPLSILIVLPLASSLPAASIKIAFHNGGTTVAGFDSRPDGSIFASSVDTINNIANNGGVGLTFSGVSLATADGAATTATISGNSGFSSFNNNGWGGGTDDRVMMEGWYGFRESESITIAGLPTNFTSQGYTVTIYGDSDTTSRTMNYTIGATTLTINDTGTFSGTFSEGDNFTTFTGLTASSFQIFGNDALTSGRSAINGIVIEAVPEPSGLLLLSLAGFGVLRRRR